MDREPVMILVGGIGAVIEALLALLLAFGVALTPAQTAAVMGVVGAVTVVVLALLARQQVYPAAKVDRYMLDAEAVLGAGKG